MTPDAEVAAFSARLESHFAEVYRSAMADVPICNEALAVASVGFRPWRGHALGIVVTPWFMNILLVTLQGAPKVSGAPGATQSVSLPCGNVDFLVADLEGFGRLLMCSLFSPMQDFADHEAALATATAAVAALMDEASLAQAPEPEIYPFAPATPRETPGERAEKYRLRESAEAPRMDRRAFFLRGGEKAPSP
jgi:[NiFe] hydrogenase assembly HybE family chaperone